MRCPQLPIVVNTPVLFPLDLFALLTFAVLDLHLPVLAFSA